MIEIYLVFASFILAYFAFVKGIIKFRLNCSFLTMHKLMWTLIILATIPLANTLIHDLPIAKYVEQAPYKIFSQIIIFFWNLSLVVLIIYLFRKLITPAKFTAHNATKYLSGCYHIIANGIDTDIQQLSAELSRSVQEILNSTSQDTKEKTKNSALSLIAIFSDKLFCQKIITHCPITLYKIFETVIPNCTQNQSNDHVFITRLIYFLFTESESQLHREEKYYGLGQFGTFKSLIF